MAVDTAAEGLHGVVEVHAAQIAPTHDAVEFGERGVARRGGAQVVAGGEGVAGVDAAAHARLLLDAFDDVGQLFEPESEVGTLSGGVFDDGRHAVRAVERQVDRLGDAVEALGFADLPQVAPGMEIEPVESQFFAAVHLVEESLARLGQTLGFGVTQVDQIGVVGQNLGRSVAELFAGPAEIVDLTGRERPGRPLALVLGEEGEARGADGAGVGRGVDYAARGADVCSEIFHFRKMKEKGRNRKIRGPTLRQSYGFSELFHKFAKEKMQINFITNDLTI